MKWPACSPVLYPIENIWSVLKRQIYRDGRQISSEDALWEAILDAARESLALLMLLHVISLLCPESSYTTIAEQKFSLTGSMDKRLRTVISNGGSYISY